MMVMMAMTMVVAAFFVVLMVVMSMVVNARFVVMMVVVPMIVGVAASLMMMVPVILMMVVMMIGLLADRSPQHHRPQQHDDQKGNTRCQHVRMKLRLQQVLEHDDVEEVQRQTDARKGTAK